MTAVASTSRYLRDDAESLRLQCLWQTFCCHVEADAQRAPGPAVCSITAIGVVHAVLVGERQNVSEGFESIFEAKSAWFSL